MPELQLTVRDSKDASPKIWQTAKLNNKEVLHGVKDKWTELKVPSVGVGFGVGVGFDVGVGTVKRVNFKECKRENCKANV